MTVAHSEIARPTVQFPAHFTEAIRAPNPDHFRRRERFIRIRRELREFSATVDDF
jgi:hypothetical protein